MSGTRKAVEAMATAKAKAKAKATKSRIDWDGMAKLLISNEARKEFMNLRWTFDDLNHELQTKFNQDADQYVRSGAWKAQRNFNLTTKVEKACMTKTTVLLRG